MTMMCSKSKIIPAETPDARELRFEFSSWLKNEAEADRDAGELLDYTVRLEAQFKQDILVRWVCLDLKEITVDMVRRSIIWAKNQLDLRRKLWPVDRGREVERMEIQIRKALTKYGHGKGVALSGVQKYCKVKEAGHGGMTAFNQAVTALERGQEIKRFTQKAANGKTAVYLRFVDDGY